MSPPDPADIRDRVQEIARRELSLSEPIPTDADLSEHLDSVQRLTLVVALEDAFEINFEPEDEREVRTLDDVVGLVMRKVGDAG